MNNNKLLRRAIACGAIFPLTMGSACAASWELNDDSEYKKIHYEAVLAEKKLSVDVLTTAKRIAKYDSANGRRAHTKLRTQALRAGKWAAAKVIPVSIGVLFLR